MVLIVACFINISESDPFFNFFIVVVVSGIKFLFAFSFYLAEYNI